ncbi:MAG: 50S ribosomal protein L11 methyltransferase, partial [Clostridia bacterium]|nr:50S ribosomal protein L11 methyltransferase [Clostridia bacterium]
MNYKQMNIETLSTGQEVVSNLLIAAGVGGFEVIDPQDFKEFIETVTPHWDYVDEELLKRQSDRTIIKVYAADNEQGAAMFKDIEQRIEALRTDPQAALYGTLEITVCDLPEEDWQSGWKQYYKPIHVNNLVVVPLWEDYQAQANETIMKIDPGMAFGTGAHETTRLCLKALTNLDLAGKTLLDVGCGSGILSIGGVLLGAESAFGCDIDQLAVEVAKRNAELNGLSDRTAYAAGDLLSVVEGQYPIVVANIVADVILMLLKDLKTVLLPGGTFIASGIIDNRKGELIDAIQAQGFTIETIEEERGWV